MKNLYTNSIVALFFFAAISISNAQNTNQQLWTKTSPDKYNAVKKVHRSNDPKSADYYVLDLNKLKTVLQGAPVRGKFSGQSNLIISFPTSSGKMERFKVMESPIMHAVLADKFPMIKTYAAQGVDDPTATMRFSITQFGLHTMTLSGTHPTNYIDPYTEDRSVYIVYDKSSLGGARQNFECLTADGVRLPSTEKNIAGTMANTDDQKLRTFRLAQSCNAEYGNIFAVNAGTEKADIMAQMTITINRVNGIYERDLSVTMEFVANNDLIIYYGSTSADPWSGEYNTKTAQTIDAAIGVNNYDIGHNFNTSGGGSAGCIGCVCLSADQTSDHKGRGYTGSSDPTGDAFDVDYVAHEMGHQYGGYHVMNTCSRSGSGSTEVEPASGSSIMGYAGICSTNIQAHSDDDFNYVNVRDISANIQSGNSTCASITNLTNQPPTANAGADYVIPKGTAFILEGQGSDPDGNASLTYNWSENDPAQSPGNAEPQSTYTSGPLYRSIRPTVSPNRYMPSIADVIAGNLTPTWEVTPSVGRTLNFSFIVRDNDVTGGQTASDLMKVTVNGTAGPFVITSHSTTSTWNEGSTQTITWNVASTSTGAVNTPNVNIYLSTDGGYTYPITLASNVPNNGSATITVPSGVTTTAGRFMVRGAGNIFYDINNANLTIQASEFVMNVADTVQEVCPQTTATYNFNYDTFLSFNETTTFSATGIPAGATATFTPATASANATAVQMTITGLTSAMTGSYPINITGTSASVTKTASVSLGVLESQPAVPALVSPANWATGVSTATLAWAAASGPGVLYDVEISSDASFATIDFSANDVATNAYSASGLSAQTVYYWRVKAHNTCGASVFSDPYAFTTSSCANLASTNVPVTISASGTPTVNSTLNVTTTGVITDVNVKGLTGTHSWINDLTVKLKSPAGTTITLWSGICNNENDFNVNFDDAASSSTLPCPPTDGLTYRPNMALSTFNGESAVGTWTLTISDAANQDGGSLTAWGLDICTDVATGVFENSSKSISVYPNPANGIFNVDLGSLADDIYQIKITNNLGSIVAAKSVSGTKGNYTIDLSDKSSGVYFVTFVGNSNVTTQKIVVQK